MRMAGAARREAATGPPRVLLVESLDAPGSDRADARDRCAALRALRAVVRVAVLHPDGEGSALGAHAAIAASGAFAEWDAGPGGLQRLRAFAREGRFDLILIAAATPGGGAAARALRIGVPVRWWPTGIPPAPRWSARFGLGRGAEAPPLEANTDGADGPPGLAWSSVGPRPAGRGRLTLWDGEYLLAPLGLAGDDGSRLLAAFAGLAGRWCGLDLVVLAEPSPAFEREARAYGIGPRVHFVGRAPREAEWAWWAHARGAVLSGRGPVSGGLLLRGLQAGCPLIVMRSDPVGAAVHAWLSRHGGLCDISARDGHPATALAHLVERGTAVEDAAARGRALAADHDWSRLAARLSAALPALAIPGSRPVRPAAA
jgi:hypothetical protein